MSKSIFCYYLSLEEDCTASATNDWNCCNNKAEKCGENEGDCDNDSHCKAGLKCGTDNCPSGFPLNYDCCYKESGNPIGPNNCTASSTPKDPSCCNKNTEKCGENEGDCDFDSHCKAGLKCGTNNCPSGFPSDYDCCYKESSIVYCGEAIKCGENEGDCDIDSHCKAGLKCGTDNCPSDFPSTYDCCYKELGMITV